MEKQASNQEIKYPYMPEGGNIIYVDENDSNIQAAKQWAQAHSLDETMPNASLIVDKNGQIIGRGANGSDYHKQNICERVRQSMPTGEGYELCEGCHPKNHSEPKAINDALANNQSLEGSALYLWGHWWCCEPCWDVMLENGIDTVYLLRGSERLFNKGVVGNIVGKQFD